MNDDPLEKIIEGKVVAHAKTKGCIVYKFTSPSKRSVPDRIFITPAGVVFFIEFKRLHQKPTPSQAVEIEKIRSKGVSVFVVDDVATGKKVVDGMLVDRQKAVDLEEY